MRPLLLALLLFVSSAVPVLANDEQDCFQGKVPQLRIKGCSEIIQRAPDDATAYHNRAVVYELSGDIDRAIADYTKTIEIRPDNAAAYENRGRAYASKGDYTHAIADAMKASRSRRWGLRGYRAIRVRSTVQRRFWKFSSSLRNGQSFAFR